MKKMLGVSSGRTTFRKRAQRPAPSTLAASSSSAGDRLEAGQEDDDVRPEALPDGHRDDRRHGQGRVAQPFLRRNPEQADELVEEPRVRAVDPLPDEGDRDRRGDDRQEIGRPDPRDPADGLIEGERQEERDQHPERHRHDRVEGGVAERLEEPVVRGERDEVVQPDELRRAQQVPFRQADRERRQDRPGRQDGQPDQGRGQEEQCPATLPAERASTAPAAPTAPGARPRADDRDHGTPRPRGPSLTCPPGARSRPAGPHRSPDAPSCSAH